MARLYLIMGSYLVLFNFRGLTVLQQAVGGHRPTYTTTMELIGTSPHPITVM